jgi:UDP-2,3-diacylglucosamine hydrolase
MSNSRLVIVSDAHLGAVPRQVEDRFLAFLDAVPDLGDRLLINGDLFDFWFAYHRTIPRAGIRIVSRLAELARRMPVAMTGGNHDRWGGTFWQEELGIQFSGDRLRLQLGPRTVLALHGDGVAEAHWRGGLMHRVTRHPFAITLFRLLHPDVGIWMVKHFSRQLADSTRQAETLDRAAIRQRQWADRELRAEPGVAILVMGHTHRPAAEELRPGQWYVNPGAWLDGYHYAVADSGSVELKQFRA